MKFIIADTSSLILYEKIGRLDILEKTFSELIITKQVAQEYGDLPQWITVKKVTDESKFALLLGSLGEGEASSIALALDYENSLLIIDDKKGRNIARKLNIEIIGSLGVLLKAKEKGIIESLRSIIEVINATNFRISESIIEKIIRKGGE